MKKELSSRSLGLVSGTFSNKKSSRSRSRTKTRRGRSRERRIEPPATEEKSTGAPKISGPPPRRLDGHGGLEKREYVRPFSDRDLQIIRSMSDGERHEHDEIFDIEERYSRSDTPCSTLSPASSQDSGDYDETEGEEDSFGDHYVVSDNDERESDAESITDEEKSVEKNGNYLNRILNKLEDRLQIKEVLEGLHVLQGINGAKTMFGDRDKASGSDAEEDTSRKVEELEIKLRKEVRRNKWLEKKLYETERRHISEAVRQKNKIQSLESMLLLQQRTMASDIEADKQRRTDIDESRNDHEDSQRERIDCQTESKDTIMRTSTEKHSLETRNAFADNDQIDLNKLRAMLELEGQRYRELELSEAKARRLLAAEKKKSEAMSKENRNMESAMSNLSKKAMGRRNGGGNEAEGLRALLREKDKQIADIKRLLKNHPLDMHHWLPHTIAPESQQNDGSLNELPTPDLDFTVGGCLESFDIVSLQTQPFYCERMNNHFTV